MSLKDLLADGRIRPHKTSASEIEELMRMVDRDLADAGIVKLSPDRRFATVYNAALLLATIALRSSGHCLVGTGHHWATLHDLPEIMGPQVQARSDFFDSCRSKRNITDCDRSGAISNHEVEEIRTEVLAFRDELLSWLEKNHPTFLPKRSNP